MSEFKPDDVVDVVRKWTSAKNQMRLSQTALWSGPVARNGDFLVTKGAIDEEFINALGRAMGRTPDARDLQDWCQTPIDSIVKSTGWSDADAESFHELCAAIFQLLRKD